MENNELNNQGGIQEEQTQVKAVKKKGHGPLYWIVVIVGVAFIIYMSLLIGEKLDKAVNPDTNTNQPESNSNMESNVTSNEPENKEVKITDKVKMDYIKKYVSLLEEQPIQIKHSEPSETYSYFFPKEIYALDKFERKDITADNATIAMVFSFNEKTDYIANQSLAPETIKRLGTKEGEFTYIPVSDFINDYKTLFGLSAISTKDIGYRCEDYVYDSKINAFVLVANGCGFVGPMASQKTYIYDITEDNNNAYVYVAYGVLGTDENKVEVFTDYYMKNKYTGKVTKDFTINESNYKDFSQYKYTFTKNSDSTYTFSQFSLLK